MVRIKRLSEMVGNNMKICLVNPPISRSEITLPTEGEPLGLLYIATVLKNHIKNIDLTVLDEARSGFSIDNIVDRIIIEKPDIVGISINFTLVKDNTLKLAKMIKTQNDKIIIVLGGNVATLEYNNFLTYQFIDIIVRGEGEYSFYELVNQIRDNKSLNNVKGIAFKDKHNTIISNPIRNPITDLDSLPFPDRTILEGYKQSQTMSIITSRGCPYNCFYCSTVSFWGINWRRRSAKNMLSEIKLVAKNNKKLRKIIFSDDIFTVDKKRVIEFCNLLMEHNINNITWGCSSRIENIDEEMLLHMSKSGCRGIFFGIESGSDSVLKKMGRKYTVSSVKKIINTCVKFGIRPTASFMIGIPQETKKDALETLRLIDEIGTYDLRVNIFSVLPGTPIHQNPLNYNIEIVENNIPDLDYKSNINTMYFTVKEIQEYYSTACRIWSRKVRKTQLFEKRLKENREKFNMETN